MALSVKMFLSKFRRSSISYPEYARSQVRCWSKLCCCSELYIHGRLTPAQKVKPNMAEFEGVLVRHPQSSTCTAVRQYI